MNINRKLYTKIALVLLGFSPIFWNSNPAQAVTGNLNLDNEDFTFTPGGAGVNNAPGNSAIDNSATINFGDHFDDSGTFLLLGTSDATGSAGSGNPSQNTVSLSQQFDITSSNHASGLYVSFDWAFNGTDDTNDSFVVKISDQDENNILDIMTQSSYGSGTFNQKVDVSSLAVGTDYNLLVILNEQASDGRNSAAGFDNISVAVPFEFSPGLGLLMMGGLFGGSTYLKKRKLAANVNFD